MRWDGDGPTAVVGIGCTEFAKSLEDSERVLALRAIGAALDDAGLGPGGGRRPVAATRWRPPRRSTSPATWASATSPTSARSPTAAGAGCAVVGQAAMAVATGPVQRGRGLAEPQAGRRHQPALGRRRRAGCRATSSAGAGRGACCGRWTRSPCSPGATCTTYGTTRDHLANVALAVPPPRQRQPRGGDGRTSHDPGGLHGGAVGLRAAVPVRQLPGDRRRGGGGHHVRRAGPGPAGSRRRWCTPGPSPCPRSTRR